MDKVFFVSSVSAVCSVCWRENVASMDEVLNVKKLDTLNNFTTKNIENLVQKQI